MTRGRGLPSDLQYFSTSTPRVPGVPRSRVLESDRGIDASMPANVPRNVKPFRARIHYRIVFNEVGETIQDLRNLSHVYRSLADPTTGVFSPLLSILSCYSYQLSKLCTSLDMFIVTSVQGIFYLGTAPDY